MNLSGGSFVDVVQRGPLAAAVAVSALVGVIGFLSPCVLPLVPGYLSYVTGLAGQGARSGANSRGRAVAGAALFVAGFTVVFVASGALFGQLGTAMRAHSAALQQVMGAVTIVLGLVFLGIFRPLQQVRRLSVTPRAGLLGAPLVGVTFGLVWTPCLTPTFTAVFSLAISQASAGRGAVLALAYCVGLGLPFVAVGLGFGWVQSSIGLVRRHNGLVTRVGGAVLVSLGIALVTGWWAVWIGELQGAFPTAGFSV